MTPVSLRLRCDAFVQDEMALRKKLHNELVDMKVSD